MIYIGIDVAKDKHDCFITNSEGEVLFNAFTIPNNADGFHDLFQKISSLTNDFSNVKVGLEATGHYNYNLLGFLIDKGLPIPICFVKVLALDRQKPIKWMPIRLLL